MKKNLLIVLPSLIMCVVLAALICVAVFRDFGNDGNKPDNLIHPHELTLVEEKQATCTEDGHCAYYVCGECDKWFSDADGKNEITDKASVTIEGTHNFVNGECQKCGAEHDCNYSAVVTPPTCTEAGFTTYECVCGLSYTDNFTEPAEHDYSYGKCRICGAEHDCKYTESVTQPTCTERGFTAYTCTCGNGYKDSYTPTLGHEYVDAICTRCGKIFGALEYKFYNTYYTCIGIDSSFDIEDITELIIPSTYRGYPVKGIENNAFEQCVYLTKITLSDGITSIGNYAFNQCNLASIDLPDSLESIGGYAFQNCTKLESVTFSDNLKSIGTHAFDGCTSLTGIVLPDSVGSIGEAAFSTCTSLSSMTLGNGLKTINLWLFYDCPSLTRITIPDSVVIVYAYAFSKCTNLSVVSLPSGLTNIYRNAFSYTAITDIYYDGTVAQWLEINKGENWDAEIADYTVHCTDNDYNRNYTVGLSYIVAADGTYVCSGKGNAMVTEIVIPAKYKGIAVTAIGARAFNSAHLTSVILPDSVEKISMLAFAYTDIKSITIGNGMTLIDMYAFSNCTSLTDIYYNGTVDEWRAVKKNVDWNYNAGNYTVHCKDGNCVDKETEGLSYTLSDDGTYYICSGIGTATDTEIVIAATYNFFPVKAIGRSAFRWKSELTNVFIPDSIISIGESAFWGCNGLTSITIPAGVTTIENCAFLGCDSLTIYCEVASKPDGWDSEWNCYESFNDFGLELYANYCPVVWNCKNNDVADDGNIYTVIDGIRYAIKDGVASVVRQSRLISGNRTILQTITYKNTKINVTAIADSAFSGYGSLNGIIIPDGVTSIGKRAFYSCTGLTSVTIPDSVISIGDFAFQSCRHLESLILGNGINFIGRRAFGYCSELKSIQIPAKVTLISDELFSYCSSLMSITIHKDVKTIGGYVFNDCGSLTNIVFEGTIRQWKEIDKATGWNRYIKKLIIKCTDGDIENNDAELKFTLTTDGEYYICNGINAANDDGITDIIIPLSYNGKPVVEIGERAFKDCKNLERISISDSVTTIGHYAFGNCSSLKKIIISHNVTDIGNYAFYGCSSLVEITVPAGVTALESYTFASCTKLERIIFEGTMDEWNAIPHTGWLYLNNCTIVCTDGQFKSGHI